jgi:hypothetical protein|tara:strand:+ start:1152 stop:2543 length:1392 start_codon:yes stop_codon:yes gene_type:complete
MLNDLFPHPLIARTGRIDSWIKNPEGRLPVSCTVFVVEDSIEGDNGIEASWRFVSHALRFGAGVAVHLSKIRPNGHTNEKGLVASGPVSFGKVYSALNETIRRGGVYKNGACVLHLDLDHADILEFITTPRHELPWVKRCVDLTPQMWKDTPHKQALLEGIKSGDIWLNKIKHDRHGERIYSNVCLEVYLPSRGTCLLQHVNLAACTVGNIQEGFSAAMSELCDLHARTGVGKSGEYLASSVDKQVGLGMLGLANLLRREGITYEQFGHALDAVNYGLEPEGTAGIIAREIDLGIQKAKQIALSHQMERAFAIAPTASCSYSSKDLDGYTCCPEIAPPIARSVDRDSGTFGVTSYDYGDVEIASEVGWDAYKRVADGIMTMLHKTGLLHGYSFNSWSDVVTYDNTFVEEWLDSPQTSLYYSLQVMGDTQDKSSAYAALDEGDVDDYLSGILKPEPIKCIGCEE